MMDKLKSPVAIIKLVIVIFWLPIVPLGIYSYITSSWIKAYIYVVDHGFTKAYKICSLDDTISQCPDILIERYFIFMIIMGSLISMFGLVAFLLVKMETGVLRQIDIGYHVTLAVLLLVAGALYILSAMQIDHNFSDYDGRYSYNFRKTEKIIAGSLTAVQGLLHCATAALIFKLY